MAEQISRRSNNVTSAPFESPFENHLVRFGRGTLNLKDSLDAMEGWSRLTNIWHQNEGEATARPGQTVTATHSGTCHSIRKLRDPGGHTFTRFWGVDTTIRRGQGGAIATVDSGYSGDPLSLLPHRPTLSGDPWMFVGDSSKMSKIRGDGLVAPIGLPAPALPATALGVEYRRNIATFSTADATAVADGHWVLVAGTDENENESDPPTAEDEFSIPGGATPDIYFVTVPGGVDSPYDSWAGVALTANLTTLAPTTGSTPDIPASDDDIIHVWIKTSNPAAVREIRLYLVCSETFDATKLPGTDSTANQDAYVKAIRQNDFTQYIQGLQTQIEAAEVARVYALRDQDLHDRSVEDDRAAWADARASQDSLRASGVQIGTGSHQWFELGSLGLPLRRGEFQRIGSSPGRDWATITGLICYIALDETAVAFAVGDLYLTGGHGPDTIEPGAQPYDYRVTDYDPRTGAESNGSPEQLRAAYLDPLRREIAITPVASGNAAIRQRIYRRGGALYDDWYFVGENTADGEVFLDHESDDGLAASGLLPTDHFQPIPTIHGDGYTILGQAVPALWGPVEGMLFACGDPHRPGHVYFCIPGQPDHWSANGNVEVCAPSEDLMHGGVVSGQAFVFSRSKLYFLYPNLSGNAGGVTAAPSRCTRGLLGRWSFCLGPGGLIFFVAEDGVFVTDGGAESWLSEAINPLFYGTAVNGYLPVDKSHPELLRLTVWENDLYFQYQDLSGARQILVFSILQKFWRHYHFAQPHATLQGDDEDVLLLGGTGASYSHTGTSDNLAPIACVIRTGAFSGAKREEKLFGDSFLDVIGNGVDLSVQYFLNEENYPNTTQAISGGAAWRQRFILDAFGTAPQKAHSISTEVRWSSAAAPPTLFQLGYAITLQPDITNRRVTNWDDLNSPDETWLTGVTLDCDTGGEDKIVLVERDFGGTITTVDTLIVNCAGRHKRKFSWLAVPANQVRLRPSGGCEFWLLYRADWIYVQEPPRIAAWDIHFENAWDQYYTGLDLYCDTFGAEKRIEVWVDEVRLVNSLAGGLTYWPISTDGRRVVHLTLPWGRGHVFRFFALDDNPGLLYTHRWHLQEEPSEQANWNQNFSILGTRADKWLKAIVFECDTFDQPKQVQIEVDGTTVETLTVQANGRRVLQLSLANQHLGRVWRMFPVDANPGRLYSAEPIFDEEPFQLARWETQETNHGLPGWFYPLYGHITLKSTADVTLTTVVQHNQVGGTTSHTYTIPATGGQKQRRFLNGFQAGKGVLIKYVLTSAVPFWLYRDETVLTIQPWGAYHSILVQPFGNDDQDPSRPMTHSVLAAQQAGGAAGGAGAVSGGE